MYINLPIRRIVLNLGVVSYKEFETRWNKTLLQMNNKMYMGLKLLFTCTCYSLNVDVTGHYFYITYNTTIPKKSLML